MIETRNSNAAARDHGNESLNREEWMVLAKRFDERGRRLDTLLPLYYAGGLCKVPKLCCAVCRRDLDHAQFTALANPVPGKPSRLRLDAVARCPDCDKVTLFRQEYEAANKPASESDAQQTEHSSAYPTTVAKPDSFDLVSRARMIASARGESPAERARPLLRRIGRRTLDLRWAYTLTTANCISIALHMPWEPAQWSQNLLIAVYQTSAPMAVSLWAVYELGVLWASQLERVESPAR